MINYTATKESLRQSGYALIPQLYTAQEISSITNLIEQKESLNANYRKSNQVFAIRQFLKEYPELVSLIFKESIRQLTQEIFGPDYFVIKSIYFDKPEQANWYVAYHQDLMITLAQKESVPGFGPWRAKQDQYSVQPPVPVLEGIYTLRIHLDDTDATNGALKVIPGSHQKGILRPELIDRDNTTEVLCPVPAGGVMLMQPLLLHSSGRNQENKRRRVIHIEFSRTALPTPLSWSEQLYF